MVGGGGKGLMTSIEEDFDELVVVLVGVDVETSGVLEERLESRLTLAEAIEEDWGLLLPLAEEEE